MNTENTSAESSFTLPDTPVPIFWTGGWDSTFRVLDVVIHDNCPVQPLYVIDENRKSSEHEIRAMDAIRAALGERYPEKISLLRDTQYFHRRELEIPDEDSARFNTLRSTMQVSWQYEWLAAARVASDFDKVEVMVHGNDIAKPWAFLRDNSVERKYPCGATTYELVNWEGTGDFEEGMRLFHHFSYPCINTPKADMELLARERGFAEFLELTWFCHYPIGDQPCGACYVCRYVAYDGLAKRFPRSAKMRNKVWFLVHPVRLLLSNPDRFVQRIRDLARWQKTNYSKSE